MRDVFIEKVQNYPHLDNNQIHNINDIFRQGEGIYILDGPPPIEVIKQFPNFMGEFGLLLINNIWFFTVSNKKACFIPIGLDNYISKGSVQFFAHSHPNDGTTANLFPSFPDLENSDAIDHKIYIISIYGITEVDINSAQNLNNLDERWYNYILDNHISYEYYEQSKYNVYMSFMEYLGCKINLISFDEYHKFEEILNSKQYLQDEFWNRKVGTTPYPGKTYN